jgi:hypothetical protein
MWDGWVLPRLASIQAHGANPFFRGYRESFATRHRVSAEIVFPALPDSSPLSAEHETIPIAGVGEVYSFTTAHYQAHPDFPLFDALPGAGAVFAPRLLVAFGAQRERFPSAEARQKYAGIAPVTERSGKKSWVHWRWQCPTFLRQTFVEWAAESTRHAFWAQVYYQQQRDKGKAHQAAVRALAFKWLRILYRCWQTRTPYDESTYLNALKKRGSPLLNQLGTQT